MALFGRPSERDESRAAGYAAWLGRQHPLALPSLLLSAFSLTHFGTLWVDEIAGIVLGVVALARLRRPPRTEGHWLALAGIVVGFLSLGCAVVVYFVLRPRG